MCDEDDGTLTGSAYATVGGQLGDQMFRMIVYFVPRRTVGEGGDVCIVAVGQYSRVLLL